MAKRVLLVAATTGYQLRVFESAARAMGLDVVLATDRCHQLEDPWGDNALAVRFEQPQKAAAELSRLQPPPDAILAVGDRPTGIAALTASSLGLPFHPYAAVRRCGNKFLLRTAFREAGLPAPDYYRVTSADDADTASYPCVLKPLGLSGSRGVIRADNPAEFRAAFCRIRAIDKKQQILAETYIPGEEYAIEGIVTNGQLQPLAIFDKPDPLEGPFFEETIYVTPSRAPATVQDALIRATQDGVRALGLTYGPIHAEMRHNSQGVWLLEIASRPIGGLCAHALRFEGGMALEELLLRHALGEDVSRIRREPDASGVMMIPIPENGFYRGVTGTEKALAVPNVTGVVITAMEGQRLLKLPEGASYLGFLFAKAPDPRVVEEALREAHSHLRFDVAAELPVLR